jgi:hypothetical protein
LGEGEQEVGEGEVTVCPNAPLAQLKLVLGKENLSPRLELILGLGYNVRNQRMSSPSRISRREEHNYGVRSSI